MERLPGRIAVIRSVAVILVVAVRQYLSRLATEFRPMKHAWSALLPRRQRRDRERRPDDKISCATGMIHGCDCGTEYVAVPKEIPLANDEQCICAGCGCELRGRWS